MLHPKSRWKMTPVAAEEIQILVDELSLHPLVARILIRRGLREKEEVKQFLQPSLASLHDPFLLHDMTKAVERIRAAIQNQERIRIYGDYDVDGVSSTSLMLHVFEALGAQVDYYIPNRFQEGYGLHQAAIQLAKDEGISLMVTVDTGISAVEQAKFAKSIGLDLIITDHHEPSAVIPEAVAVLNPKKPNCSYPDKQLAGVGVAAKLATALLGEVPTRWLDLVALGTIADLVPLKGENRIFASFGLSCMNSQTNIGLTELMAVSGIEKKVNAGHVGFSLGPRINAIGRLSSATEAVELLTTNDRTQAKQLAMLLNEKNMERQALVDAATTEAVAQVEADRQLHRKVIVVYQEDWNLGVVGIVASRLVETFYRPTIVLGKDQKTGLLKGSARSIRGFHLHRALTEVSELLSTYGGHEMAAGMALSEKNLPHFHSKLTELAEEWLTSADYIKETLVEEKISLTDANTVLIDSLNQLEPYGMGNPVPLFQIEGAEAYRLDWMGGQSNHLKLHLKDDSGNKLEAVRFRCSELAGQLTVGANTQIVGELQVNEWNGKRKAQVLIRDLAIPHLQIFDWRTNRKEARVAELAGKAVLCICSSKERYTNLEDGQLYTWDDVIPHDLPFAHLALLDAPPSVARFRTVIQSLKNMERIYVCFGDEDMVYRLPVVPGREKCKLMYQTLWAKRSTRIPMQASIDALSRRLGISARVIRFLMDVFEELNFIAIENDQVEVLANPAKRDLLESKIYQQGRDQAEVLQTLIYSSFRELSKTIKGA
ncbi:single-stranded-DNA-specific exonuclease RecJ [Shimazuella sp. AN120528]|uniref:single-stranded-DNA-specific exonuclease RecJ n=1 Tax=Shimazuella soli TaxID=1892854 RepID=UPI001F106BE6|nr:single-stranded-DNA-specific exonuclease RecJ [Shimazuella soli]MCH5584134.1 single-stranded-DNA-specific exonuclease RecJ [Shimazuella soli]